MRVIMTRLMGMILLAIAVEMILDGVKAILPWSGLAGGRAGASRRPDELAVCVTLPDIAFGSYLRVRINAHACRILECVQGL